MPKTEYKGSNQTPHDEQLLRSRRNFLKNSGLTLAGILLGLSSSCSQKSQGNERIDEYLRTQYNNADLNQIDEKEVEWTIANYGDFIRQYMPYVGTEQLTQRDKAFLSQLKGITEIRSYMTINPDNFTDEQRNAISEFNPRKRKLTNADLEYIAAIPWMPKDQNGLTDKDKAWLILNMRATAEFYMLNQ